MIFLSFGFFLLLFLAIGLISNLKSRHTDADYLLASQSEKPWLIAFASVATDNSGYMFIGMVGYAYLNGLATFWIMFCVLLGDFAASLLVHKKLRIKAAEMRALSFPETLAKWHGTDYNLLRKISAVILVVFLCVYAAAQLRAGGKAMHVLFGFDYAIGSIISAVIVLCYCVSGGIRASIWSSTAQAFVMIGAMILLFCCAINKIGSLHEFFLALKNISPEYLSIYPRNLLFSPQIGLGLFIFGWFFGGYGIVGQPHVMTGFMALNKAENLKQVRIFYYSWYFIFFSSVILTGIAARILIPFDPGFDAELALPTLSKQILPDILIGVILAGLFSATMSTADSQILSSSGAISNDLLSKKLQGKFNTKIITAIIAIIALLIAIFDNQSVFSLVMIAWLALACSFGPVITLYALNKKLSQKMALTCMLTGFSVMMIWRYFGLGSSIYEAAPGIIAGLMPYFIYAIMAKIVKK